MKLIELTDLDGLHHFINKKYIVAIQQNPDNLDYAMVITVSHKVATDEKFFDMLRILED